MAVEGVSDLQFWLQILNVGLAVALVVAGHRGYVVWRWHYNQMLALLQQRYDDEHAARLKAERDATIMRDMLFEALGVNKAVIEKLDLTNGPITGLTSRPLPAT